VSIQSQGNDVVASYLLYRAPTYDHDQWPNGTYDLGLAADSVRSRDGTPNPETGAGSYWLWFPDTYVELRGTQLIDDGWYLYTTRWMRHPDPQATVTTSVRITGPLGDQVVQSQGAYGDSRNDIVLRAEGAAGPWDYADSGTYSFAVGEYTGSQLAGYRPVRQEWLWFTNPKTEILATDFTDTDVLVTARFSDDHAIDASSVRLSSLTITAGPYHIPHPSYNAVPQQDGSVIATFRFTWGRPWSSRDNGDWLYGPSISGLRDVDGNYSKMGVVLRQPHLFTTLTTSSTEMAAYAEDPTTVTFKMTFWTTNLDVATLGDDDLRLDLNGRSHQLSLAYTYSIGIDNQHEPMLVAAYTLHLAPGERLDTGTARFYLNAGALSISGRPSGEQFVGSWWLWFN
jgi:hypothetical protein